MHKHILVHFQANNTHKPLFTPNHICVRHCLLTRCDVSIDIPQWT